MCSLLLKPAAGLLLDRLEDPAPCVQCAAILAAGRICDLDDEAPVERLAGFRV